VGVVGAITPFNFPLAIPAGKIAPALLYGNTVVWKPAPITPLVSARLAEACAECQLPAGVLNLVLGLGPVGERIVRHPDVHAVSFTGSTAVGRHLLAVAGEQGKALQTEMGGKNAAIVLADADIARAAEDVAKGVTGMAGQKCTATSRAIVVDDAYDEFVEALVTRIGAVHVGAPMDAATEMGPVASDGQLARVSSYVDGAVRAGSTVVVGGEPYESPPLSDGYYFPPTILEAMPSDRIWNEEVFGPVLSLCRTADCEEAIDLANLSPYGLSAALFTSSLGDAMRAVEELDVGVVHINSETTGIEPHVPFGGVKASGTPPAELGHTARDFYTRAKTVYLRPWVA
jgi:aldehyde dehydrogenase (NAD+)